MHPQWMVIFMEVKALQKKKEYLAGLKER